jgi:hypothetical protein
LTNAIVVNSLKHVYFFNLDHPLHPLLAHRYSGIGIVSDLLAALTAVPNSGFCGGWGIGVIERDHHAAGKSFAEEVA